MEAAILGQAILQGLLVGGFFGLVAVGLNLIFGVMNVLNVSQGDFVVLGAYLSFWAFALFRTNPFVTLVPVTILFFVIGVLTYRGLMRRASKFGINATLIVAFGISISLENLMTAFWTQEPRLVSIHLPTYHMFSLTFPLELVEMFAFSLVFSVALYLFLVRTFVGKAILAVSMDEMAATLMGINPGRMKGLAYGLGLSLAGVSGILLSFVYAFDPTVGVNYTVIAFLIIALGGVGNPIGAFAAGLIIGVAESVVNLFLPGSGIIAAFAIFLVILLARPEGIFRKIGAA